MGSEDIQLRAMPWVYLGAAVALATGGLREMAELFILLAGITHVGWLVVSALRKRR